MQYKVSQKIISRYQSRQICFSNDFEPERKSFMFVDNPCGASHLRWSTNQGLTSHTQLCWDIRIKWRKPAQKTFPDESIHVYSMQEESPQIPEENFPDFLVFTSHTMPYLNT